MLDQNQDAYGAELRAYLAYGEKIEIVERDDLYLEYNESITNYFLPYEHWTIYEKAAIRFASGRALDVGCGAGRVSLHLQDRGLKVVAIDNSPGAVKISSDRGVKDARLLDFSAASATNVGSFDSVVMFGNNFGLFGSFSEARDHLKRLGSMTYSGAAIIAQTTDPYATTDPVHLNYHKRNREQGRMGGQIRLRLRHKQVVGEWFDYLLVSKQELEDIVSGTCWKVEKYINTLGPQYFVILRKQE